MERERRQGEEEKQVEHIDEKRLRRRGRPGEEEGGQEEMRRGGDEEEGNVLRSLKQPVSQNGCLFHESPSPRLHITPASSNQ